MLLSQPPVLVSKGLCTRRLLFLAWLSPILMSGLIELLQAYCTGGTRSGDWIDLAANAIGVTMAAVLGMVVTAFRK